MTRFATKLVRLGRSSADREGAVNPPLVRASTTLFAGLDELSEARRGLAYAVPRYGIYGTSTTFELQSAMAELCGTESCIATASGLSAIAAVLGAHASPGSRILLQQGVYEPTLRMAEEALGRICEVVTFASVEELEPLVDERTSLVFIEVPTSLTMRMIDVRAVAAIAARHGVPLACDATWGTPRFFDAHGLGVDIAVHAATKYIGGHADLMLGLVTGTLEALASTRDWLRLHGSTVAPDICWLALRGLRTLDVRLERHQRSALDLATWLQAQPQVEEVLYPALPGDPGHELWAEQFSGAAGPLSIALRPAGPRTVARFVESLRLFGLGASWGGFESLVLPAAPDEQLAGELEDGALRVRLHIGLEDPDDLRADLAAALASL